MQAGAWYPSTISQVKGVSLEEDRTIIITPATSFSHITNDPIIKKHLSMLGRQWTRWGGPQVRRYGHHRREYLQWGHLCGLCLHHVRPECCSGVKRAGGVQEVPVTEFYTGPGRTVRKQENEVCTAFKITRENYEGWEGHYIKYRKTKGHGNCNTGMCGEGKAVA